MDTLSRGGPIGLQFVAAVLALVLLLHGCKSAGAGGSSARPSEDAAVIQAAMLYFFEDGAWDKFNWPAGDFVVIQSEWESTDRSDFARQLEGAIALLKSTPESRYDLTTLDYEEAQAELKTLLSIRERSAQPVGEYDPGPVEPIADLTARLDNRIVAKELKDRESGWQLSDLNTINRDGREGTVRVPCIIGVPGYSKDGRFAVVQGVLKSPIHKAVVDIFLEKSDKGWGVVLHNSLDFTGTGFD